MNRRRYAVMLLAATSVGCGSSAPEPVIVPIPTHHSQVCLMARVSGTLVPDPRWGLALSDPTGRRSKPVWPAGVVALRDGDRIGLFDHSGRLIAHAGDTIESGGGLIGANGDLDNTTMICGEIKVTAHG
jgi:hypothetical protein